MDKRSCAITNIFKHAAIVSGTDFLLLACLGIYIFNYRWSIYFAGEFA